jgi:serine/threonine-protein kinase
MTRCPSCNEAVAGAGRFCASCGAALGASAIATVAMAERKPPSSSSGTDEGRFPAGTVLGERYRILGLLGRGGMGEVYRAFDLKLDQTVALKFLPAATARDSRLLERFRGEVRVARQVSHRNVCRVHDIGEADGAAFISMEYVDGEDLGSLLRRIGRLPGDKAIEFSRRLCAGLAAAHEKGVLHRDLKPANIMIDGRGQVLIMDFGLAAAADAIAGRDIRSGTPAYMAPEQKEGREVTVRSDIYSLGLVLAEMFTGQKASEDRKLSATVKDIDPAVEKVIQRCLDPNPAKRPATALDVARGLPGGDPLAEALAAGDTPSPEMVAASEDTGALSVRAAVACLVAVIAGLAAVVFWGSRYSVINMTPMPYSPDNLELKAHELAARLGYTEPPVDKVRGFSYYTVYRDWAEKALRERRLKPEEYRAQLVQGQPSVLFFSYSQSPQPIVPMGALGTVTADDPKRIPGWVDIRLDPQGRLVFFQAVPQRETAASTSAIDWHKLFEAAGLDASRWTPAEPREIPLTAFDERKAWTGTYPNSPQMPLRIEAAAWKGRPVYFEMFGPWRPEPTTAVDRTPIAVNVIVAIVLVALVVLILFALSNLRSGRGDLSGAVRLAAFVLVCNCISQFLSLHHTATPWEVSKLTEAVASALFLAALAWALYMAVEPYVRRHWPQVLIGWTRALEGHFRDPLVAGHILAGIAAGIGVAVLTSAADTVTGTYRSPMASSLDTMGVIGGWFGLLARQPTFALTLFFLFLLLRLLLRRTWLAVSLVVVAFAGLSVAIEPLAWLASAPFVVAMLLLNVAVSIRFGMLALTASLVLIPSFGLPLTSHFSAWFAPQGWMEVAFVLAVALWSFRNALGGRKVLKGEFLES